MSHATKIQTCQFPTESHRIQHYLSFLLLFSLRVFPWTLHRHRVLSSGQRSPGRLPEAPALSLPGVAEDALRWPSAVAPERHAVRPWRRHGSPGCCWMERRGFNHFWSGMVGTWVGRPLVSRWPTCTTYNMTCKWCNTSCIFANIMLVNLYVASSTWRTSM